MISLPAVGSAFIVDCFLITLRPPQPETVASGVSWIRCCSRQPAPCYFYFHAPASRLASFCQAENPATFSSCMVQYQHVSFNFRTSGIFRFLPTSPPTASRLVGVIPAHAHSYSWRNCFRSLFNFKQSKFKVLIHLAGQQVNSSAITIIFKFSFRLGFLRRNSSGMI